MLNNLEIRNIALIERLNIDLQAGMTVLTGETGAGKSIIIDSVNLILGSRANKGLIRYGEEKARVQGFFTVNERVAGQLSKLGIDVEEGEVTVLRDVTSDGRSVCRINGMLVTGAMLREAAELLVNIHGQQDNQALLNPKYHLSYLDGFAGNGREAESYAAEYESCRALKKRLDKINGSQREREERIDLLRYQTEELCAAALVEGEKEELLDERALIENAEQLSAAVGEACELLYDGEINAYELVSRAANALSKISEVGDAERITEKILDIKYAAEDVVSEIRALGDGVEFSRARLDEIEDRLDLINKMERKYGGSVKAAQEYLESASKELEDLDIGGENLQQLEAELAEAEQRRKKAAEKLTAARVDSGERLSREIESVLRELDMPNVRFSVDVRPADYSSSGADCVEFLICPNVGEELKPLAKFASGGELSRVMLAMKSILADSDDAETLIFDEIDTGVSGSAAQKIAKKLKALGEKKQVICVSHQPQLAAAAKQHLLIKKSQNGERTTTGVTELDFDGRVAELARIIDGNEPSSAAILHAKAMIKDA